MTVVTSCAALGPGLRRDERLIAIHKEKCRSCPRRRAS